MGDYNGLHFKTRGNANPQGKPRVYFCCCSEDFSSWFEPISNEILSYRSNAAIWYYDPAEGIPEGSGFRADLAQMQLFTIPITSNFIFLDNPARTREFAFAVEHHIPVLPLMQEPGLEAEFNRICGDLQFLDKNASEQDPTALPYTEKLKTFLESVLASDEMAEKIRAAFDAYIFLSYRKKDRKYAQQIMHLIHENKFCRDIAIWYDEFLKPGEDFNNAISQALEKSCLFALTVTPNLLEDKNYVLTEEYPAARKSGKPILPIESVATSHQLMLQKYEGIGEISPVSDKAAIQARLSENLCQVAKEPSEDPQHLFFMGLAYLSGIDLEINHALAYDMITRAADGGIAEAHRKLVAMFSNGEGIERNYETAIFWQKRYVDLLRKQPASFEATQTHLDALHALGRMQMQVWDTSGAKNSFYQMRDLAGQRFREKKAPDTAKDYFFALYLLGRIYNYERNYEESRNQYITAVNLANGFGKELMSSRIRCCLMSCYLELSKNCMEGKNNAIAQKWLDLALEQWNQLKRSDEIQDDLGLMQTICLTQEELCIRNGNRKEAKKWIDQLYNISKQWAEATDGYVPRRSLAIAYTRLGQLDMLEGRFEDAKKHYLEANERFQALEQEFRTVQCRVDLSINCRELYDLFDKMSDLDQAHYWVQQELEIREKLAEMRKGYAKRDLAVCYSTQGSLCIKRGDYAGAKEWQRKASTLMEEIMQENPSEVNGCDLAISYGQLGNSCLRTRKVDEARQWLNKELNLCNNLQKQYHSVQVKERLIDGYCNQYSLCRAEGNQKQRKEWRRKAIKVQKQIAENQRTNSSYRELADRYRYFYDLLLPFGDPEEKKEMLLNEYEIRERVAYKSKTVEDNRALATTCEKLGDVFCEERKYREADKWYQAAFQISKNIVRTNGGSISDRDQAMYFELANCYSQMGELQIKLKNKKERFDIAEKYYQEGITILECLLQKEFTAEASTELRKLYLKMGQVIGLKYGVREMVQWLKQDKEFVQLGWFDALESIKMMCSSYKFWGK